LLSVASWSSSDSIVIELHRLYSQMNYSKWDHLEDSDDEAPVQPEPRRAQAAEEMPPGIPAGAKKVDLNALPPELANDPKLMSELQGRGMLEGGGVSKVHATPKGSEKVMITMMNFHNTSILSRYIEVAVLLVLNFSYPLLVVLFRAGTPSSIKVKLFTSGSSRSMK